ncbi:MAG: TraR/DksA family transcriptional regulator [Pyrinomonadaceae bacterium]
MNAEQIQNYKKSLLAQRENLVGQINESQRQTFDFDRENMQDPVDVAVSDRDQTIMLSISESERTLLNQIDEALQRIELSSYGECMNCGQEITEARLKAVPYAQYCINCQDLLERGLLDDPESA